MLTRPIRWELIEHQYDQLVKYATALRHGTVESEQVLRRFIHEGLQVVEHWNSANTVIFYGKDSELTGPDRETQEISMLALHLLQSALVHVNTILVQRVLQEPAWSDRLTVDDRRGLTLLFWSNVNPCGTFRLDMNRRLDLDRGPGALRTALDGCCEPTGAGDGPWWTPPELIGLTWIGR